MLRDGQVRFYDFMETVNIFLSVSQSPLLSASCKKIAEGITQILLSGVKEKEEAEFRRILKVADKLLHNFEEWRLLDARTKSNETSSLSNIGDILASENMSDFFLESVNRQELQMEDVANGKIIVVTASGTTDLGLALALAKILKSEFYRVVQTREVGFSDNSRFVGVVMDEFPLCVVGGTNASSDVYRTLLCAIPSVF